MPKQVRTEAFVLKKKNLPTRDSIITLLTKEYGKLQVFAKGVRVITSKRLPHLQTGNLIQIRLAKTHDKYYLQETSLISAFLEIKKDPHKLSHMYFLFFVIDRLFPEAQKEEREYQHIKRFIATIAKKDYSPSMHELEDILNKLLFLLGYLTRENSNQNIEHLRHTIEGLINEKLPFFSI